MNKKLLVLIMLAGLTLFSACGGGGDTSDPNIGFQIQTTRIEVSRTTGNRIYRPTGMRVTGQFIEPQGNIQGTVESFTQDIFNLQQITGAKVPAKWRLTYIELFQPGAVPCFPLGGEVVRNVNPGEVEELLCSASVFPIAVNPSIIDAQNPPSKINIEVEGITNDYAPPQVAIFDEFGEMKATMPATINSLGKGKIEINTPDLTQFRNGSYQITISNVKADGSWDTIGATDIWIFNLISPDFPTHIDPCLNQSANCLF